MAGVNHSNWRAKKRNREQITERAGTKNPNDGPNNRNREQLTERSGASFGRSEEEGRKGEKQDFLRDPMIDGLRSDGREMKRSVAGAQ
jgi:hypothetical protein